MCLKYAKYRENALLKNISNLYFSNNFLHIFSQTNVFIGFYNKKGIKLFETCIKLSSKSTFFHQNDLGVFEPS